MSRKNYKPVLFGLVLAGCMVSNPTFAVSDDGAKNNKPPKCAVVEEGSGKRFLEDHLAPYWAQQAIGADLLKEGTDKYYPDSAMIDVAVVSQGILKSRIINKASEVQTLRADIPNAQLRSGTRIANLMFGKGPYATSNRAQLKIEQKVDGMLSLLEFIDVVERSGVKLVYLSNELSGLEPSDYLNLKRLTDAGVIIIAAAEDTYPAAPIRELREIGAIVVGSLAPDGLVSISSQHDVDIFVPADEFVLSKGIGSGHVQTGSNNAAAAMATGVVANLLSILPDLQPGELQTMLTQSALPSYPQRAYVSNAGMLNAYRLINAAHVLRKNGFVGASASTRTSLLQDSANYQFQIGTDSIQAGYEKFKNQANDCEIRQKGALALRAAFLLNDSRASVFSQLQETFHDDSLGGFKNKLSATALLYESIVADIDTYYKERIRSLSWDNEQRTEHAYHFASRLPQENRFQLMAQNFILETKQNEWAVMRALSIGPRSYPFIMEKMMTEKGYRHYLYLKLYLTAIGANNTQWQKQVVELIRALNTAAPHDERYRLQQAWLGAFARYTVTTEDDLRDRGQIGQELARAVVSDFNQTQRKSILEEQYGTVINVMQRVLSNAELRNEDRRNINYFLNEVR